MKPSERMRQHLLNQRKNEEETMAERVKRIEALEREQMQARKRAALRRHRKR